ncbi:MAG: hypothetical protein JW709_02865 [Sedimentisphaerales bacterium]|nr:hypothetical protein [Sedimentisphaerales bacterium]
MAYTAAASAATNKTYYKTGANSSTTSTETSDTRAGTSDAASTATSATKKGAASATAIIFVGGDDCGGEWVWLGMGSKAR